MDFVLRGEADDSFPALVSALASGKTVTNIPGLTFREKGRIRRNPNGPAILDMDLLPLPAYDLVPAFKNPVAIPLEAGRGCPFSCTFCSTNDFFRRRFRLKSPAHVLDEMNRLYRTWGVPEFNLVHDMFTVDRRRVVEFCETMLAAGAPYRWSCSARTDCVDPELIALMSKAGCHDIFFGVETGSQRMQRVIDKDLDLAAARTVLRQLNGLSVHATASLIVGYPQETAQDVRDTVNFLADAMMLPWVDPQLNILSPLAATPLTEEFFDRLTLDDHWTEVSENGTLQDGVDRLLIAAHPDIFPGFYAFPYYTDRRILRRMRDFLFAGLRRCGGLMRALHLHTSDLMGVFERWDRLYPNASQHWFESTEFTGHLIRFCLAEYGASAAVRATALFYRQTHEESAHPGPAPIPEAHLRLADRVLLVDCDCDIGSVMEALAAGREPDARVFSSPTTVAIRQLLLERADIRRFPPLSTDLLRHARKGSAISEILRDFETRNITAAGMPPATVALGGIKILEDDGFVRRVFPNQSDTAAGPGLVNAAMVSSSGNVPATLNPI